MKLRVPIAAIATMLSIPSVASEQGTPLPDPSAVEAPDVTPSVDPNVVKEGYKFYYFHSNEANFAQAYEDLRQCRAFLSEAAPATVPGFIPWDEAHSGVQPTVSNPYGLVGDVMASIIVPKITRGLRSNKMRRCMGTRGYVRYAIPEKTWNLLNEGDERQLILMQAKLASGPEPKAEAVRE